MPMWQMNDENLEFYKRLDYKKLNVYENMHIIDND